MLGEVRSPQSEKAEGFGALSPFHAWRSAKPAKRESGRLWSFEPVSCLEKCEARKARKRKALELWTRLKIRGTAGRAIFLNWHFQARFYFLCQFPMPQVPVYMFQRLYD